LFPWSSVLVFFLMFTLPRPPLFRTHSRHPRLRILISFFYNSQQIVPPSRRRGLLSTGSFWPPPFSCLFALVPLITEKFGPPFSAGIQSKLLGLGLFLCLLNPTKNYVFSFCLFRNFPFVHLCFVLFSLRLLFFPRDTLVNLLLFSFFQKTFCSDLLPRSRKKLWPPLTYPPFPPHPPPRNFPY